MIIYSHRESSQLGPTRDFTAHVYVLAFQSSENGCKAEATYENTVQFELGSDETHVLTCERKFVSF